MFSIRNSVIMGIVALCTVGCQTKRDEKPAVFNDSRSMNIDAATQQRNWDMTRAGYANTRVPAKSERTTFRASDSTIESAGWITETPIFLTNVTLMPFTYLTTPRGEIINHPGVITPPTYTAMPRTQVIPSYGLDQNADARGDGPTVKSR